MEAVLVVVADPRCEHRVRRVRAATGLGLRRAVMRLEEDPVAADEADDRHRRLEELRRQCRDPVEGQLRRRVEHSIALRGGKARRLKPGARRLVLGSRHGRRRRHSGTEIPRRCDESQHGLRPPACRHGNEFPNEIGRRLGPLCHASLSSIDHAMETRALHTDNGVKGAALAGDRKPDLIACDVHLPGQRAAPPPREDGCHGHDPRRRRSFDKS